MGRFNITWVRLYAFALTAKGFFETSPKKIFDDKYDQEMYQAFWSEFNELLEFACM